MSTIPRRPHRSVLRECASIFVPLALLVIVIVLMSYAGGAK